ncbi:hypothetical protein, partial [Caballeronia mineralivorans]|uniref:hypothetical protein n=1 Tax=Caballeronia mineralivorans TaxID=2010198 RepID=UPI001F4649CD
LEMTSRRLRLRDERRSRSFDQIPMFADDIKGKVAALDFFVMLKNSCFSTESTGVRLSASASFRPEQRCECDRGGEPGRGAGTPARGAILVQWSPQLSGSTKS